MRPTRTRRDCFQNWLHSFEAPQIIVDLGGQHSMHPLVQEKPGRRKLNEIKLFKEDPAGVERDAEQIKTRYLRLFRV
jgi:iron(III) transport system substrate-binding protein